MPAQYSGTSEVSLALAVWLSSDSYDYNNDPNVISATTLLKPVRQIILASRIPPGEGLPSLSSKVANRIGSAIHDAIEQSWVNNYAKAMDALGIPESVVSRVLINPKPEELTEGCIPIYLEQRLSKKVGKWVVSGKFDFVSEGKVQDFKSTKLYSYKKQNNAIKYIEQGSIYRWLNPTIITADTMEVHYIFTNWSPIEAKTDDGGVIGNTLTQSFNLMSYESTDTFIKAKLALIDQYRDAEEESIPYCSDSDLWRSDPVSKYYAKGDVNAARSTKNFATANEAYAYKASKGGVGSIKEVPGQVIACKYCPALGVCSQARNLMLSGDLIL